MVCIYCGGETKVTNSRLQKRANQIWRRRKCLNCRAVFTTTEGVDASLALSVNKKGRLEPFLRDKLLLDVYDSLRHRKTAISDATALTDTILKGLQPEIKDAALPVPTITTVTAEVLDRFDKVAATHYRAFHSARQ